MKRKRIFGLISFGTTSLVMLFVIGASVYTSLQKKTVSSQAHKKNVSAQAVCGDDGKAHIEINYKNTQKGRAKPLVVDVEIKDNQTGAKTSIDKIDIGKEQSGNLKTDKTNLNSGSLVITVKRSDDKGREEQLGVNYVGVVCDPEVKKSQNPTQPECSLIPSENDVLVSGIHEVYADRGEDKSKIAFDTQIVHGQYKITTQVYDDHSINPHTQENESYLLNLLGEENQVLYTTAETGDLDDGVDEMTKVLSESLTINSPIAQLEVRHAQFPGKSGPESVHHVCTLFTRLDSAPEEQFIILDLNEATTDPVNPDEELPPLPEESQDLSSTPKDEEPTTVEVELSDATTDPVVPNNEVLNPDEEVIVPQPEEPTENISEEEVVDDSISNEDNDISGGFGNIVAANDNNQEDLDQNNLNTLQQEAPKNQFIANLPTPVQTIVKPLQSAASFFTGFIGGQNPLNRSTDNRTKAAADSNTNTSGFKVSPSNLSNDGQRVALAQQNQNSDRGVSPGDAVAPGEELVGDPVVVEPEYQRGNPWVIVGIAGFLLAIGIVMALWKRRDSLFGKKQKAAVMQGDPYTGSIPQVESQPSPPTGHGVLAQTTESALGTVYKPSAAQPKAAPLQAQPLPPPPTSAPHPGVPVSGIPNSLEQGHLDNYADSLANNPVAAPGKPQPRPPQDT